MSRSQRLTFDQHSTDNEAPAPTTLIALIVIINTMRLQSSLVLLSLLQTTTAGKHKQAKTHKHRAKKLEHQKEIDTSLIQTKALTWPWYPAPNNDVTRVFGPKHKGRLCNSLTSSVVLFDVDNSGGLDWAEFQVFSTAIFDVVEDHVKG